MIWNQHRVTLARIALPLNQSTALPLVKGVFIIFRGVIERNRLQVYGCKFLIETDITLILSHTNKNWLTGLHPNDDFSFFKTKTKLNGISQLMPFQQLLK